MVSEGGSPKKKTAAPRPKKSQPRSAKPPARSPRAPAAAMTVVAAVKRDLAEFEKRQTGISKSGLAASALELARQLDNKKNSATAKSMCARALREALDRIRELVPPAHEKDGLDDLTARREQRRTGGAGTKGSRAP